MKKAYREVFEKILRPICFAKNTLCPNDYCTCMMECVQAENDMKRRLFVWKRRINWEIYK